MLLPLLVSSLVSLSTSSPQTVGGEYETLHHWDAPHPNISFGGSAANAGDLTGDGYDDVIIGAPWDNPAGMSFAGSAYAYSGFDGSLIFMASGTQLEDSFGQSVSGVGDLNGDGRNDFVVGAPSSDFSSTAGAGFARAYSGASGVILFEWHGLTQHDTFGSVVAAAGDLNGDAIPDILVSAPRSDPNGLSNAGSVYAYSGADGSLLQQWDGTTIDGLFGFAVASAGDIDADGTPDVVIGAPVANHAFVYSGATGLLLSGWVGTSPGDQLGYSVSTAGDLDQDGFSDYMLSANFENVNGLVNAGSVYVISGQTGIHLYKFEGLNALGELGFSIASAGDVNFDGFADIILGEPHSGTGQMINSGFAYLYSGADGSLMHSWAGNNTGDWLGSTVASAGDHNHDGRPDVLVSAAFANSTDGAVSIHSWNPFLTSNTTQISDSASTFIGLDLQFPANAGNDLFEVLLSESGVGPFYRGVAIPLSPDQLLVASFNGNYPAPLHNNMQGTLDANGFAQSFAVFPAGTLTTKIGKTYYMAAVAHKLGQNPEYSSAVLAFEITL